MTLQNGTLAGNPVLNELESLCSYVGDQLIYKERRHQRQLMDMIHNLRVYYITKKTILPQNFQCLQDYEIAMCAVESFLFPTFSTQHPEVTETECIHYLITKVYISFSKLFQVYKVSLFRWCQVFSHGHVISI